MKKRLAAYDYLRILGCFLVVMVHVSAIHFYQLPVTGSAFLFTQIYDCLGICGVPLFIMISGALFLNPEKEFQISHFLKHNFLRIGIIYVCTILFYNIVNYLLTESAFSFSTFKTSVLIPTVSGQGVGIGHLWYLPTILVLYLLTPVLRKAFSERKICEYFLVLYFLIAILWNTLLLFDLPFFSVYSSLYQLFPFQLITGYIGYYVLGHYIAQYCRHLQRKFLVITALIAIGGMVFTVFFCMWDSLRQGSASSLTNNPFSIGMFLSVASVFALFLNKRNSTVENSKHGTAVKEKSNKLIPFISGLTLSIYLFHPFVLRMIEETAISTDYLHPAIGIPVLVLFVFIISAIIAVFIKLIILLQKKICYSITNKHKRKKNEA